MTDNEIIKALKCCGNIVDSTYKECVYHETYNASCVVRLMRDALGLINRQKAEIEELYKLLDKKILENKAQKVAIERLQKLINENKGIIEWLLEELSEAAETESD